MVEGPRACQESEFEEVIALINQVFRTGTNQDIRTDYPLVFNGSKMEYMRILKVDGKVVAHVPVWLREAIIGNDRLQDRYHQSHRHTPGLPQTRICYPLSCGTVSASWKKRVCPCPYYGRWRRRFPSISSPVGRRLSHRVCSTSCAQKNTRFSIAELSTWFNTTQGTPIRLMQ